MGLPALEQRIPVGALFIVGRTRTDQSTTLGFPRRSAAPKTRQRSIAEAIAEAAERTLIVCQGLISTSMEATRRR